MYTTDQFNVFGSEASATYTGDTDGGLLGTGRADQAVSYHNDLFKILDLGAQVQFRTTENDDVVDGAGLSAQLTILPGTKIGATYTKTLLRRPDEGGVRGLGGDAEIAAVGARLDWKGSAGGPGVRAAAQRRPDHVPVGTVPGGDLEWSPSSFDADGVEGFARVNFPGFAVYGGFNYYTAGRQRSAHQPRLPRPLRDRGAEVHLAETTYLYTEAGCSTTASVPAVRKASTC